MSRRTQANPQWVESVADKHNLPLPILDGECEIDPYSELGSGLYGVVYNTDSRDCVFKATTDATEAHFIQSAINLRKDYGVDPEGIVDYRAVFAVGGEKHKGDRIFITWRERALSVGLPESVARSNASMLKFVDAMGEYYAATEGDEGDPGAFWLAVAQQQRSGQKAYWSWLNERVALANEMIDGRVEPSGSTMATKLFQAHVAAGNIAASGKDGRHIGDSLLEYFASGLLICDLHANNVGVVERDGKRIWVLTDCGHCLATAEDVRDVAIPTLRI